MHSIDGKIRFDLIDFNEGDEKQVGSLVFTNIPSRSTKDDEDNMKSFEIADKLIQKDLE